MRAIAVLALAVLLVPQSAARGDHHVYVAKGKPVLELFTSQGCSSCPPADALLGAYAGRTDVIALTMPVDYWDYLGWKDTLASPRNSDRQRAYAKARGDGEVYTPQIVVNGLAHAIGSIQTSIDRAITRTQRRLSGQRTGLKMWSEGDALVIEVAAAGNDAKWRKGSIWLALIDRKVEVRIERGENRGRKIAYYNVVRELTPIGKWDGKPVKLRLPKDHLMNRAAEGCTVLLQAGKDGPILAAVEMKNW